jgi:hypothetical protein
MVKWHCKTLGGPFKCATWKENKTMFLVMALFYESTVIVRYTFNGIPNAIFMTLIYLENFMGSIIFLRIAWYFLQQGLKKFDPGEAKYFEISLKIVMITGYVVYFGLVVLRIVESIILGQDELCT